MAYRPATLAREAARMLRSGAAYRKGLPALRPTTRRHYANGTAGALHVRPVLLLHGFLQTRASLDAVEHAANDSGYDTYSHNYKTLGAGVAAAADGLRATIDSVCRDAGVDTVHIVAHSMGGLVARAAINDEDTAAHVRSVITLGTPHSGTPAALLAGRLMPALATIIGEFMPGSAVLDELADANPGRHVTWTALYSPDDHLVPGEHGRLDAPRYHATNIAFHGIGHAGLLYDPGVLAATVATLDTADIDKRQRRVRSRTD